MAAEDRVVAAQRIHPYIRSPWFVIVPDGAPSEPDDLDAINAAGFRIIEREVMGWGEHDVIIRVGDVYYLARLA